MNQKSDNTLTRLKTLKEKWLVEKVKEMNPYGKLSTKMVKRNGKMIPKITCTYIEDFVDEDTGEVITLERSYVVRLGDILYKMDGSKILIKNLI